MLKKVINNTNENRKTDGKTLILESYRDCTVMRFSQKIRPDLGCRPDDFDIKIIAQRVSSLEDNHGIFVEKSNKKLEVIDLKNKPHTVFAIHNFNKYHNRIVILGFTDVDWIFDEILKDERCNCNFLIKRMSENYLGKTVDLS